MRENKPKMTTTTPSTGQAGSNSGKNGDDNASASVKAKAKSEANKEKKKKQKEKEKERRRNNNNNNNINYVRHEGLIAEGIMKSLTINPGTSTTMGNEFLKYRKVAAAYAAAKGWEHLSQVIETMEPLEAKTWTTTRPDKSKYTKKIINKILMGVNGEPDIRKKEWIITDCDAQDEAEDNYSNMQRQKLTEYALYWENSAAMYVVLYGQLHSDIIAIAKNSTSYTNMHKERDVVGLLSTFRDICVQHLTGTKVDPYLEQLRILTSTLCCVQKTNTSNHDYGDAIYDQVLAPQSQCGTFAFGKKYHLKVLTDDGISDLIGYFALTQEQREDYDELARQLIFARLIITDSLSSKTRVFLKEQYIVNQSNYPDTVVNTVAMITSLGNGAVNGTTNGKGGGRGNNNDANKNPEAIVSIHLANDGDDCSNNDDGPVESSESMADERGTDDGDIHPGAEAPAINSDAGYNDIDENVVTNKGKTNNNDDNNEDGDDAGDDEEDSSNVEDPILNDNNTDSTTTPDDDGHVLGSMTAMVDDDKEDDGVNNEFCSDYDLDNDGIFDNDSINEGEAFVCMTLSDTWDRHHLMNTKTMISYCHTVCLMSIIVPAFILISSTVFSTTVLAIRISTTIRLLRPKYYTTPC